MVTPSPSDDAALLEKPLRIGTRGSKLALWQAEHVRDRLIERWGEALTIELVIISTKGDQIQDRPLYKIGGKGLFVNAIEEAIAEDRVDLAVHSMKDLPGSLAPGMILACTPPREDPRDTVLFRADLPPEQRSLAALPSGSRIGTTSLRRSALCRRLHPGAEILPLRGNVQTRMARLEAGDFDAILLAAAGLRRLEILSDEMELLDPEVFCPAAGQGILAVECRETDERVRRLLEPLGDPETSIVAAAERAFLARLEGGCQVPMGAYATLADGELEIRGIIGDPSGRPFFSGRKCGAPENAAALGRELAETLLGLGADRVLERFVSRD